MHARTIHKYGCKKGASHLGCAFFSFYVERDAIPLYDRNTCSQYLHLFMPSSSVPPQFGHWMVPTLIGKPAVWNAASLSAQSPRRRLSRARYASPVLRPICAIVPHPQWILSTCGARLPRIPCFYPEKKLLIPASSVWMPGSRQ